jgi:hypothetical protein
MLAVKLLPPPPPNLPAKIYAGDEVKIHWQYISSGSSVNVGRTESENALEKWMQYRE